MLFLTSSTGNYIRLHSLSNLNAPIFMFRRHFIKLSATASAAILFNRITLSAGGASLINTPDEVWAQTNVGWQQLRSNGHSSFTFNDIEVGLKPANGATSVFVRSPQTALLSLRLKWKYEVGSTVKALGDEWERLYGDAAWKNAVSGTKNAWYVLLYDGAQTSCFGVKTG